MTAFDKGEGRILDGYKDLRTTEQLNTVSKTALSWTEWALWLFFGTLGKSHFISFGKNDFLFQK